MIRLRTLLLTAVAAVALLPSAQAQTALSSGTPTAATFVAAGFFDSVFSLSVGLADLEEHVQERGERFGVDFKRWGNALYTSLFLLQFLLIGATMLVRGPFALASNRPGSAFGPFANFFFFLVAGALGYLFVAYSYYPLAGSGEPGGWVMWFYDLFTQAGRTTGCDDGPRVLGLADPCSPDQLASLGAKVSGLILALSQKSGGESTVVNKVFTAAGASTGVFGAFSVLAIQLSITRIAFQLAIVSAPLFLATLIFKPISGIATGFISFVLYLGVRLFVLYLIAGLAAYIAGQWLQTIITAMLIAAATSSMGALGGAAAKVFSTNLTVLTMSLLFLGLTLYLPSRIAGSVSGAFRLDLNALLFQGELPIQMD